MIVWTANICFDDFGGSVFEDQVDHFSVDKINQRPYQLRDLDGKPISDAVSRELSLQYRVPDEIRKRNNKRFRRNQVEQKREKRMRKQLKRR